jgi:hypothetical protein
LGSGRLGACLQLKSLERPLASKGYHKIRLALAERRSGASIEKELRRRKSLQP